MTKSISEIKQRLYDLIEAIGVNSNQFALSIGKDRSYIHNITKEIQTDVLRKIYSKYPHVNIMWIITGEGDMFVSPNPSDVLFQHLKEENQELKLRNEELNREIGKLQEQIKEIKKRVPVEGDAICADVSGSCLEK